MQTKHIQLLLDQYSRQLRSSTSQQHSVSTTRLNIGNEAYLLLRQTYRLNCQPDTLQSCGCQTSTANIEGYLYCSVNRVIYYRLIIIFAIIVCISNNGIFIILYRYIYYQYHYHYHHRRHGHGHYRCACGHSYEPHPTLTAASVM